jgi:hypothetical protein
MCKVLGKLHDSKTVKSNTFFFLLVPPSIYGSDELVQLTAIEGNLITLLCESSGIPPPDLTWKKKGQFGSLKVLNDR